MFRRATSALVSLCVGFTLVTIAPACAPRPPQPAEMQGIQFAVERDLHESYASFVARASSAHTMSQKFEELDHGGGDDLIFENGQPVIVAGVPRKSVTALAAEIGATVRIEKRVRPPLTSALEDAKIRDATSPGLFTPAGGTGYVTPLSPTKLGICSLGLSGSTPMLGTVFLTAGHCTKGEGEFDPDEDSHQVWWSKMTNLDAVKADFALGFFRYANVGSSLDNTAAASPDVGVVQVTNANAKIGSIVTKWEGAFDSGTDASQWNHVQILGQELNPRVGMEVCMSGALSGWKCGHIVNANHTFTADGIVSVGLETSIVSQPGDSGGAVVAGNLAVGIEAAGDGQGNEVSALRDIIPWLDRNSASAEGFALATHPTVPTIRSTVLNLAPFVIDGKASPNAKVEVEFASSTGNVQTVSSSADSSGVWTARCPLTLTGESFSVRARTVDANTINEASSWSRSAGFGSDQGGSYYRINYEGPNLAAAGSATSFGVGTSGKLWYARKSAGATAPVTGGASSETFRELSANGDSLAASAVAVANSGTVWTIDGTGNSYRVVGADNSTSVASGSLVEFGIDDSEQLWSAPWNGGKATPVPGGVCGRDVLQVSASGASGAVSAVALAADGTVWAIGNGTSEQVHLADGSTKVSGGSLAEYGINQAGHLWQISYKGGEAAAISGPASSKTFMDISADGGNTATSAVALATDGSVLALANGTSYEIPQAKGSVQVAGASMSEFGIGPNHRAWFASYDGSKFGYITGGAASKFLIDITANGGDTPESSGAIAIASDGTIWKIDQAGNSIQLIDTH